MCACVVCVQYMLAFILEPLHCASNNRKSTLNYATEAGRDKPAKKKGQEAKEANKTNKTNVEQQMLKSKEINIYIYAVCTGPKELTTLILHFVLQPFATFSTLQPFKEVIQSTVLPSMLPSTLHSILDPAIRQSILQSFSPQSFRLQELKQSTNHSLNQSTRQSFNQTCNPSAKP